MAHRQLGRALRWGARVCGWGDSRLGKILAVASYRADRDWYRQAWDRYERSYNPRDIPGPTDPYDPYLIGYITHPKGP